jgi:hypothetical protein
MMLIQGLPSTFSCSLAFRDRVSSPHCNLPWQQTLPDYEIDGTKVACNALAFEDAQYSLRWSRLRKRKFLRADAGLSLQIKDRFQFER